MMRSRHIATLPFWLLCACGMPGSGAYRDASAPISASSRFQSEDFAGAWFIVDGFGPGAAGQVFFEPVPTGGTIRLSGTGSRAIDGEYREGVPGELIPFARTASPVIVMWVDESRQTAAIGTVSGSFGALIDRDGQVPPDKALAARGIFEFYGWDTSRMNGAGA